MYTFSQFNNVAVAERVDAMDESYYRTLVWLCKVRFLASDFSNRWIGEVGC